ncbi:phage baseplate upper protein [bacterium]|nr:phage baseplate upper protein [bacterium]
MAYITTIDLVQGDQLPEIELTLKDSNQAADGLTLDTDDPSTFAALSLSGGSVRMRLRKVGQTALLDTLVGTITDAVAGKVTFVFDSDTLSTTGVLEGEIEFTDSGSRTQTVVDLIKFKVRSQFG